MRFAARESAMFGQPDAFITQRAPGPLILYLHDIGGPIGTRIAGMIFQNLTISVEGWNPERLKVCERLGGPETPEKLAETEQFATVERDMFLHKKGAEDWALLERAGLSWARRDIAATEGQKLTLGDTTITKHLTPGHTLGTLSLLVPVKDDRRQHLAASWGGAGFNWLGNSPAYIGPDRPNKFWFDNYIKSAARFHDIAAKAGADVLIADHTRFDGSKSKLAAMGRRRPHDPHPFVIGNEAVVRSITLHSECAQAGLARE